MFIHVPVSQSDKDRLSKPLYCKTFNEHLLCIKSCSWQGDTSVNLGEGLCPKIRPLHVSFKKKIFTETRGQVTLPDPEKTDLNSEIGDFLRLARRNAGIRKVHNPPDSGATSTSKRSVILQPPFCSHSRGRGVVSWRQHHWA